MYYRIKKHNKYSSKFELATGKKKFNLRAELLNRQRKNDSNYI